MESTRQNKIARLIQKDLGTIFQQNSRLFDGAMISVTKVNVAKDLSIARVYVSLFAPKGKTGLMDKIRTQGREIRHLLGNLERNQLRVIPDLQFFEDDSLDYIDNIENLLKH